MCGMWYVEFMVFSVIYWICLSVALGAGVLAAWSDVKNFTISNRYIVIIIMSFVVVWGSQYFFAEEFVFPVLMSNISSAVIVFFITFIMFAFRLIGAADSKLASAYALWFGIGGVAPFLFYVALAGGVLALFSLFLRKFKPVKRIHSENWIVLAQNGNNKIPYGGAILFGALASFLNLGYLGI